MATSLKKDSLRTAIDYIASWLGLQSRASAQAGCVIAIALTDCILKLTPRHRFRVASPSKTFTTAGVLKLREQGKLKLEVTIGDYVAGSIAKPHGRRSAKSSRTAPAEDGRGISQFEGRRPYLSARVPDRRIQFPLQIFQSRLRAFGPSHRSHRQRTLCGLDQTRGR
jgi:hypothetical protein